MEVYLIGSAYMRADERPNMIVSFKQFDELIKSKEPIQITTFIAEGRTAAEANQNIFSAWGLTPPICPHCYQPKEPKSE